MNNAHTGLTTALGAVSSLKAVLPCAPASLNTVALPCAAIMPAQGQYTWQAIGYWRKSRVWAVYLYCGAVGQGTLSAQCQTARSVIHDVEIALMNDPTLGGQVDQIETITDNGIEVLQVGGSEYIGARVEAQVIERWILAAGNPSP